MTADERPPQTGRNPGGNAPETGREPNDSDSRAFHRLFEDACRKCFSAPFTAPLTESESHRLSVEIEESTGLEIGWKSLKNYSGYLLGRTTRVENPSVPTLDTLARYVAGAPRTDEERRRSQERHYPYWFRYRDALREPEPAPPTPESPPEPREVAEPPRVAPVRPRRPVTLAAAIAIALVALLAVLFVTDRRHERGAARFTDEFDDLSTEGLARRGWSVQDIDPAHWARRGEKPGQLTLFTLTGDNWPQPGRAPQIRNLLVRPLPAGCFVADVRLTAFFPRQNWQQAGILLLEDTAFAGRSVRLTLGYNDFSGGFPETKEVIVQAMTSQGRETSKPEEVVHQRLFVVEPATEALVRQNLESSALRIERRGAHLRLLYSAGPLKSSPFREVGRAEFDFQPRYVAIFALEGFVSRSEDMPVHLDAFGLSELGCSP